jgi:hypothetical protein
MAALEVASSCYAHMHFYCRLSVMQCQQFTRSVYRRTCNWINLRQFLRGCALSGTPEDGCLQIFDHNFSVAGSTAVGVLYQWARLSIFALLL